MTYKLNPAPMKFKSPVVLFFPDGSTKSFQLGTEATEESFEKAYQVDSLRGVGDTIQILLKERHILDTQNWNGEEVVSFF